MLATFFFVFILIMSVESTVFYLVNCRSEIPSLLLLYGVKLAECFRFSDTLLEKINGHL
jgi:hypothetical protein